MKIRKNRKKIKKKQKKVKPIKYRLKIWNTAHGRHTVQFCYNIKEALRTIKFYEKGGYDGAGFIRIEIMKIDKEKEFNIIEKTEARRIMRK